MLLGAIPCLPDLIQNQSETTLNFMALALHTVGLIYIIHYNNMHVCVCFCDSYCVCVCVCVCVEVVSAELQAESHTDEGDVGREGEEEEDNEATVLPSHSLSDLPRLRIRSDKNKNFDQQYFLIVCLKILQAFQL